MKNYIAQANFGKCLKTSFALIAGLMLSALFPGSRQAFAQTPNFGPNVYIITPDMPSSTIQTTLTNLANEAQFSANRYAILIQPGTYNIEAPVGYYESIAGLGATPGAVTVTGFLSPEYGAWTSQYSGNGPQASLGTYFWRSIENMTIDPLQNTAQNGGANTLQWGVSQGAPFRRMQVNGSLELTNSFCGSASGGFMSDTVVTGAVNPCSQQQWYTRNSTLGSWSGGVWNMVFSGVQGAPTPNYPPVSGNSSTNSYTVLPTTPVSREKPFLYIDGSGNYNVFVPAALTNSSGTTWANSSGSATSTGNEPGYTLPIGTFFIAQPSNSLSDINAALANGQNLILTPGIYQYAGSINITNPNTIVLGLGYATIVPQAGTSAITVADVDGVQIAGLIIDAGPVSSPVLLQIGVAGAPRVSHQSNPTTINDVFFRIGGATVGSAATTLEVDSNNVVLDNIWAWRADHGAGTSPVWTGNPGENGVVVDGDNVTALGLAVEHYEGAQVLWNGNGGQTIFYQSELPYDVPSQDLWMDGSANGYPSYVVSNSVATHTAYGLGVYSFFNQGTNIVEDNAITVPYAPGVIVKDAVSVFLSGNGQITHTVDNVGTVAQSGSITSYVPFYGVACTTTCPAAPSSLQAFTIAPTQVNLTWTASSTPGAVYTVFRSTSAGFTPAAGNQVATGVAGTSFADTTVVAATTYFYVVEASDVAGSSPASNQASATTTVNNGEQITTPIVSIDAGCPSATTCNKTYNSAPSGWVYDQPATTYLSGTYTFSQVNDTIVNNAGVNQAPNNVYNSYAHGGPFTYTIPGLTPGGSYIVALDFMENFSGGNSATYRQFNVAINGAQMLQNFSIYGTTGALYTSTVQSFYAIADANGHIVVAFTIGAHNNPTVNGIQVGTGSNMPPTVVAPTSLSASSVSDTQASISWTTGSSSGAVFEVFRSTTPGFTPSPSNLVTTTSGTSYKDASLLPLTTYYYLVEANNGLFSSLPSNQAGVSTPVGPAASIAEISGSGQTAGYGSNFTNPLVAIVQDAFGNLVPNATVTFAGTGVSFPSGATVVTSSNGQAQVTAQANAVGPLAITASVAGASAPANYEETGATITQSINFAAPASPVIYGVAPIALTASATSGLPLTFNVTGPATVSGSTLTITGAGQVNITATQTGNGTYAAANPVLQTITVNPATLTVTANNTSKAVGAPNPAFTASYSGFVNGDTSSVLAGSPALSTSATNSSPAGLYPISAAQGSLTAANYTFTFVNGTLSVVAPPTVSLTPSSTVTGSHSSGYTLTVTIQNTGNVAVSNLTLTAATLGTTAGTPLPQTWGTLAAGASAVFQVTLPGSVGADGAGVAEKYSGTYTGGTFSISLRSAMLP